MKMCPSTFKPLLIITILSILIAIFVFNTKKSIRLSNNSDTEAILSKEKKRANCNTNSLDTLKKEYTIIIDDIKDPRQLQQILSIIESYSVENKISNLKIKYDNMKQKSDEN